MSFRQFLRLDSLCSIAPYYTYIVFNTVFEVHGILSYYSNLRYANFLARYISCYSGSVYRGRGSHVIASGRVLKRQIRTAY